MVCYNNIGCVVIQLSTLILPKSFKGAETSNTNFVVLLGFENLLFWGNNKNLELNFPLSVEIFKIGTICTTNIK